MLNNLTLFLSCFPLFLAPPCTNVIKNVPILMLRGQPAPMPGFFVPRCDDDGFFMPEQCNPRNECWCVDRNGGELQGTRTKIGSATCDCKRLTFTLFIAHQKGFVLERIP